MMSLISLRIWLGLSLVMAHETPPSLPAQQTFRVFADVKHSGILAGPLTSSSLAQNDFGIAVPLPSRSGGRDRWPQKLDAGDKMAKRLGQLRIEATPAAGDIVISLDSESRHCLRLFLNGEGGWWRMAPSEEGSWTLAPGKDGVLEVGVGVVMPEVRAPEPPPSWPREFTATISAKSQHGERLRVPFRVAPYIIPSALEPVDELMIVSQTVTADSVRSVRAFAARTRIKLVAHEVDEMCDQWMQDTIEPGLFTFPTTEGSNQARVCLTGLRKGSRPSAARLDSLLARWLRRKGVVTVAPGVSRKQTRWIDWYGNIEATPPHIDRQGRKFRYGRVITGKQRDVTMHPGVLEFVEAQGVQWPPIVVDTSWLLIGHVDEVVNFVPAKSKAGFKVLLPSPKAARDTLQALLAKGLKDAPVFEGTDDEMTLGTLRMKISQTTENFAIDEAITRLRDQLKMELNLEDSDFVMLPALFQGGMAVIPNAVNSVVVNGHLLVPEPLGPRLDDKDGFEQAIRAALAGCDVRVAFIESWNAYHVSGGEVHCGTNTFRRLRDPAWWTYVGNANEEDK